MGTVKFLDTNALLSLGTKAYDTSFAVSSVTLQELEHIKTNKNKDDNVKYQARVATRLMDENPDKYSVVIYNNDVAKIIVEHNIQEYPDAQIIACAKYMSKTTDVIFVSNDIACKIVAKNVFGLNVESTNDEHDNVEYKGFKEVMLSECDMAHFYENMNSNTFNLLKNEYLVIKDSNNEIVDAYRWDGLKHEMLFKKNIQSLYFDKLKAKDIYQSCAIDSLINCTVTAITGKAGSGKSLLTLMAAMYLIEKGKYDRLVVMFNPTKTRGASDMGFYGGDFTDKAMQNSIGQILTTKFGDRYSVDVLMSQNKLKLVSMADCRGMEISSNEILWITEGQNTSIDLIKLCLSRVSSDAKVFIEGDYTNQVDSHLFVGDNNGLKRLIDVFKGHEEFGYVQLQNVWRSRIAELCELL